MAKILTIIPYAFYPPQNGGSLRCFYILREMACNHEVYLLTVQPEADFKVNAEPAFPGNVTLISLSNVPVYRSIFNILPAKLADAINYRLLKNELRATTNSYFLGTYRTLIQKLKEIKPAIVFFENLESTSLFSAAVKKHLPSAKRLYDAHNVDSELWGRLALVQNNSLFRGYAAHALKTEQHLDRYIDAVFCCSEHDRAKLLEMNGPGLEVRMIPNGVDCALKQFDNNPDKFNHAEILFCGSLDYYPNEEGLLWFYKNVFPLIKNALPHIKLSLVGSVRLNENCRLLENDPTVYFAGRVEDVQPYYYRASVCIAPLLSGSGTRLKILEAMSFGNPVVSTTIGAEGINYMDNKHLLVADDAAVFANKIISLLTNREQFEQIRTAAVKLVRETYDWRRIGKLLDNSINEIIAC